MTVTVELDGDSGFHELYVSDGRMSAMPAGPRLFRTLNPDEIPNIKFQHADRVQAETDAAKLRIYLDSLKPAKRLTKQQMAEAEI